jgi:hypothetical protein
MNRVGETASKLRPSAPSRWLDAHRHARLAIVLAGLALAVGLALAAGMWWEDRVFVVNTNAYVAVAGLFIVALAIERVTELAVAPWVGAGDHRITRNVIVGTFALVVGVITSGVLGLRLLSLLSQQTTTDSLAVSLDVLATGLAIGAGTKPLHDLITNLEKSTKSAKEAEAAADRPPIETSPAGVGGGEQAPVVPSGGRYRMALAVGRPAATAEGSPPVVEDVRRLLPGWNVATPRTYAEGVTAPDPPAGSALVHRPTPNVPGSPAFVNEQFAAAHRLHGVGLDVTVAPAVVRAGRATTSDAPRHSLGLLGVDAATQKRAKGGRGVRIAVLDTGLRAHADGVPWTPASPGKDVLDAGGNGEDPLLETADWRDLDLMGSAGHGTGVAAVIAAPGDSGPARYSPQWFEQSRMIGVAPEAEIFPIRVMRGPVHLLDDDVAKGVQLAIDNHCDVISMSLGGLAFRGLEEAIDKAVEAGVIVICAAGNQFGVVTEPASYPTTIAVASVTTDGTPYVDGSSRGPEVTISAPGVKVLRPDFEIDEQRTITEVLEPGTGTTYATAHVAGVAALWLARHGRTKLLTAYEPRQLPRLFAHVLATTATPWTEPHLATDWGPGRVNAHAVIDTAVVDAQGAAKVPAAALEAVFERKAAVAVTDRFAGGVAAFLRNDGAGEARDGAFHGALKLWNRLKDRSGGVPSEADEVRQDRRDRADAGAAKLLAAELRSHAGANPSFRRALSSAIDTLPVPAGATPELELVMEETNREPGDRLPADWGVGLSRPLRQALHGVGSMRRGFRSVGVAALLLAVVLVVLLDDTSAELRELVSGTAPGLALLGLGLYGSAQAIERLLEFTVGRWAFKDVPGREMDRALILLGCGVLIGAIASMVLDLGLLGQVAAEHTDDGVFRKADVVVTALAIGGGAKPIHDLLTRIKIGKLT